MVYLFGDVNRQPTMSLPLVTHFAPAASPTLASASFGAPDGHDHLGDGSTSPLAILLKADELLRQRAATAHPPAAAAAAAAAVAPAASAYLPAAVPPARQLVANAKPATLKRGLEAVAAPVAVGVLGGLPDGYLPGVMGGNVGLLPGLRTKEMLEYYGELPKQKRKSPTDLSGLTDEKKVERRKQLAREYSRRARVRNNQMKAKILEEVSGLDCMRAIFELAPHVYMVLSGDVRNTTILYANEATEDVLHHEADTLLGRSFWDFVKPADHQHVYAALGQLILNRSGVARLQCGIRTSFQDYFLPMSVTLQYGSLGIVCSLWEAETTRH